MQPLLKIQTVPISIEYKVQRAALQYQSRPAQVNVTRQRGSLNIQTQKPQLHIDTYETRASAGLKSPTRSTEEYASAGRAAGLEATRAYAENGNSLLDSSSKSAIADMVAGKMIQPAQTIMAFLPSVAPEISYDPGSISFDFFMDKLNFDWNINHKPQLEFIPGGIQYEVTQYPQVIIEYLGSPNYVPPSADPNYAPAAIDLNV